MNTSKFKIIVEKNKKKKNKVLSSFLAFLCGGVLGILSQGLFDLGYNVLKLSKDNSFAFSSIVIICIAGILTMLSFYNDLGQIFGAGLFVPTTGFVNSVMAPSIEGKDEGIIKGIGARMFSLAGSVIAIGIFSALFVTIIKYILWITGVISL